jgi:hypothetical protein
VYRGGVHVGEHPAIVDRALFDAVQAKLAAGATARQLRLKGSAAILTGRIFDDRGNRMTPTHTNKKGARYRYYVSHAVLQKRPLEAGGVSRVAAPGLEAVVLEALRNRCEAMSTAPPLDDRELVASHLGHVVVKTDQVEIYPIELPGTDEPPTRQSDGGRNVGRSVVLTVPWQGGTQIVAKGILHPPAESASTSLRNSDNLLRAIAKARAWIDDLTSGRAASFNEIAAREGLVERHVRLLAPLAFVSPLLVSDFIDGRMPAHLTVTGIAKKLAYSWATQRTDVARSTPAGR